MDDSKLPEKAKNLPAVLKNSRNKNMSPKNRERADELATIDKLHYLDKLKAAHENRTEVSHPREKQFKLAMWGLFTLLIFFGIISNMGLMFGILAANVLIYTPRITERMQLSGKKLEDKIEEVKDETNRVSGEFAAYVKDDHPLAHRYYRSIPNYGVGTHRTYIISKMWLKSIECWELADKLSENSPAKDEIHGHLMAVAGDLPQTDEGMRAALEGLDKTKTIILKLLENKRIKEQQLKDSEADTESKLFQEGFENLAKNLDFYSE